MVVERGDIFWVSFDPSIGGEITKTRPAVVVSNDIANELTNRVQVVPITSNTEKIYPCESLVQVGKKQGKAMADQIMTVSKKRLIKKVGMVIPKELAELENAIMVQLALADS